VNHSKALRALAIAAAVAGFIASPLIGSAQAPPAGGPPPPGARRDRMPANDGEFVSALNAANNAELELAKYMVNRTADPGVHGFAQRMIDDHSTAAVTLEAATRGSNVGPVPKTDAAGGMSATMLGRLQGETGTDRDNDYMRMQVPAHRRVLRLLQWEADNGQIAGLKALASGLVPTVQQHLQIAQAYLAAHNLTPYSPPPPGPVPGGMNPPGMNPSAAPRTMPTGTPNNPGSTTNGGSTAGQNNGTNPSPVPSSSPHP
jgi:putative membrane protein